MYSNLLGSVETAFGIHPGLQQGGRTEVLMASALFALYSISRAIDLLRIKS